MDSFLEKLTSQQRGQTMAVFKFNHRTYSFMFICLYVCMSLCMYAMCAWVPEEGRRTCQTLCSWSSQVVSHLVGVVGAEPTRSSRRAVRVLSY